MSLGARKYIDVEAELSDPDGSGASSDEREDDDHWTQEDLDFLAGEEDDENGDQGEDVDWYASLNNASLRNGACAICSDKIEDRAVLGDAKDCEHAFCFLCIYTWSRVRPL